MVIQLTNNKTITTAATTIQIVTENLRRTAIYVTVTSGNAVTIVKGSGSAVAGEGIVLQPNSTWYESDSEGFNCWKGEIQAIGTGAGTVAVSETVEV